MLWLIDRFASWLTVMVATEFNKLALDFVDYRLEGMDGALFGGMGLGERDSVFGGHR